MRYLSLFLAIFALGVFTACADELDDAADLKNNFQYEKALSVLAASSEHTPKEQRYLARLAFLAGHDDEARGLFGSLADKDWRDLLYTGLLQEAMRDDAAAITAYLGSLRLEDNSSALYRLAKIYYRQGDYAKAGDYFGRTIAIDKSIRLAYYYLGECYKHLDDYRQAHSYLQQATNFYPKKRDISSALAESKKKLGDKFFIQTKKEKDNKRKEFRLPLYVYDKDAPAIRVGITRDITQISFKSGESFCATDGKMRFWGQAGKFYIVERNRGMLVLKNYETGKILRRFQRNLKIVCKNYPFYIFDVVVGRGNYWHKQIDMILRGALELDGFDDTMTLVNVLSIEDYLCGVLPAEILPTSNAETLMAQAIAARTTAVKNMGRHRKEGFDVCSDVHCQAYAGMLAETARTNTAVKATRGQILVYDDKPIEACYHSNCGGCLRSDPFGQKLPYLKAKRDWRDGTMEMSGYQKDLWFISRPKDTFSFRENTGYRWQRVYDAEDFFFLTGHSLDEIKHIKFSDTGPCGHYSRVELDFAQDKDIIDKDLDIRNYFDGLRSSAFRMEIKYSSQNIPQFIILWGAGFGHGAGMSQEGAVTMGEEGCKCEDILKHYYPLAAIKKEY